MAVVQVLKELRILVLAVEGWWPGGMGMMVAVGRVLLRITY